MSRFSFNISQPQHITILTQIDNTWGLTFTSFLLNTLLDFINFSTNALRIFGSTQGKQKRKTGYI